MLNITMDKEVSEKIVSFMNMAERRYATADLKQDFVIRSVLYIYPDMPVQDVKDLIEVFITVSKLGTKFLFNLNENDCACNIQ
jgi:hypothetical protein